MLPNKLQEAIQYLEDFMYDVDDMKGYAIREELEKVIGIIKDPNYLFMSWHVDDVFAVVEDRFDSVEFSQEEAQQVLENMHRSHDASIGVNWDVIESHIDNVLEERGK